MAKAKGSTYIENMNYEAQRYCFKRGFRIFPVISGTKFKVWYERGGQGKYYDNGTVFDKKEVEQVIWDLYDKIYKHDKNNNK